MLPQTSARSSYQNIWHSSCSQAGICHYLSARIWRKFPSRRRYKFPWNYRIQQLSILPRFFHIQFTIAWECVESSHIFYETFSHQNHFETLDTIDWLIWSWVYQTLLLNSAYLVLPSQLKSLSNFIVYRLILPFYQADYWEVISLLRKLIFEVVKLLYPSI